MSKEIKWAVLGTGVIANEMAAGLQKMGKSLYAVGNRTYDKAVEMIAGAMKLKELGLVHKSLICVPKHLTAQTGAEFMRLYPAANILVAEEKDFTPQNRKPAHYIEFLNIPTNNGIHMWRFCCNDGFALL